MKNSILTSALFLTSILSYGHTSFPKKVKCPLDGKEFTIRVTMSYTTFKTLRDFQKQGAIGDLYESRINSCPKCHYSGFEDDFDTTFTPTVQEDLFKILEPFKETKITDVVENEITVKIYTYFKKDNSTLADLFLEASYFLKGKKKHDAKRKELQLNCANFYIKALESGELKKPESIATINYLIGELFRRVGDFENSIKYFDIALNDTNKKDWITSVATEQKKLAIEKDDNNKI